MRKLFTLLTLALVSIGSAWGEDYTLTAGSFDKENKISTVNEQVFTLSPAHGGVGQTGYGDYIKFSANRTYSITLPDGFVLTNVNIKGYTNKDAASNGNITQVGDIEKTNTFPARKDADLATSEAIADGFDYAVSQTGGTVDIKVGSGNQICVLITLTGTAPVATQVATPTFSPEESEFSTDKLDVTISCVTSESTILYSTNGVDYTTYSEPISISATTTIYAKATKTGLADSEVTSKTYTKVESVDVFDATGENITFVLTKANITAAKNAFVNVTTENWNTGKTYGDYSGDFYNMSSEDRQLSIKVTGAKSFEVFVQNTNSGRSYDVTVGSATTNVPHPATGIASSGVFAIADPSAETTITLGGTGSSVYPVYIVFNPAVDAEITSAGYATFSSDKAVDFSGASGVTVYAAKVNDAKTAVDLIEVKSKQVPANTAVVLKGAAGTYSATAIASAAGITGNELQIAAATMDGSAGNIFVLNEKDGVVGFYKLSASGSLLAGKGYLEVDGVGEGRTMFEIDIDGISTGISKMEDVRSKKDDVYYDLQGRRVLNPTKGLYIVNGKKVIMK